MDILSIIKSTNPDELSHNEFHEFELAIEKAIHSVNKLQRLHRELTGKEYVSPKNFDKRANKILGSLSKD